MRFVFVAYDIRDDRKRTKLYKKLVYFGLVHVQYSAFKGYIHDRDLQKLLGYLSALDLGEGEKVHVVILCQRCQRELVIFGKDPEIRTHMII